VTAGELAVVLAAVLCCIGFAALVVVLMRVLDTLRSLRSEVDSLRNETRPVLAELRSTTEQARTTMAEARHDLDRYDRVLGSAEAISGAVAGGGRVARAAAFRPAGPYGPPASRRLREAPCPAGRAAQRRHHGGISRLQVALSSLPGGPGLRRSAPVPD